MNEFGKMQFSHRSAASMAGAVVLVWLIAMVWLMSIAAERAGPGAALLVVFPLNASREEIVRAIWDADAAPAGSTLLESAWFIQTTSSNGASRLREQGALAVFADLPYFPVIAGCMPHNVARILQRSGDSPPSEGKGD